MEAGWQHFVSRGRRWGWHYGCVELVAGGVWSAKRCFAGDRQGYRGWGPKRGQKMGLAGVDAGEVIAQASRWTVTSGRSQKNG